MLVPVIRGGAGLGVTALREVATPKLAGVARFGAPPSGFPATLQQLKPVAGEPGMHVDQSGTRFSLFASQSPGHAEEQLEADAVYRALGVKVADSHGYPDPNWPGELVKVARAVEGADPLGPAFSSGADARAIKSDFAAHALLEHVGAHDSLRATRSPKGVSGHPFVADTSSALRFAAEGARKPFDAIPLGIWALRDGTNQAAAQAFGNLAWTEVDGQIFGLLRKKEAALNAVSSPELRAVLAERFANLEYLHTATRALNKTFLRGPAIDMPLKQVMLDLRRGKPLPTIDALVRSLTEQVLPPPVTAAKARAPLDVFEQGPAPRRLVTAAGGDAVAGDLGRLNETQQRVVSHFTATAAQRSRAAMPALEERALRLGFTREDVAKVLSYYRETAPIHVYFPADKAAPGGLTVLESLTQTGRYGNQFETKVSSAAFDPAGAGSGRDSWEKRLFAGIYHEHPLIPSERPKYAAFNSVGLNDYSFGIYGDCVLVLKRGVNRRVSLTSDDSGGLPAESLGTPSDMAHVLMGPKGMDDERFKRLFRFALAGNPLDASPRVGGGYIESQIHGPVEMKHDVAFLAAHARYGSRPDGLRHLAQKNQFPLYWLIDNQLVPDQR